MPRRDPELWISITAYGRRYGADRKTVHKWIAAGLCVHYRVDRLIRVKDCPPTERRQGPQKDVR